MLLDAQLDRGLIGAAEAARFAEHTGFAGYAELGVERVVLPPPSMSTVDAAATLRYLDTLADTVAELEHHA